MKKKIVATILACLLSGTFIYSAYHLWLQWREYSGGSAAYSSLSVYVNQSEVEITATETAKGIFAVPTEPTDPPEKLYDYPDIEWPEVDFAQLREINPEIVGWLYLEGTIINYPVAQAKDNQWYLNHLFDGQGNNTGCPFLDAGNAGDFSDRHSVIYAHHRKDGSMFGQLKRFKEQDYYEAHPRFLLITDHGRYVMEIFSGHVSRHDSDAWKLQFADDQEYETWLNVITERSSIDTGIVPEKTDRILTLSTCSYEFSNARYVLHGILRKAK